MPRFAHIDLSLPPTYECTCDELPADCQCDDEHERDEREADDEYDRMRDYDWREDVGAFTDEGR